jgi:hypothetical protein
MDQLGQAGLISVVPPAALEAQLAGQQQQKDAVLMAQQQAPPEELVGYVKARYEVFRNHRNTAAGWTERLLEALRSYQGQYSASKLMSIRQWGGSEVFARITTQKCRAASSLLRDIYLGTDRPWAIDPPPEPEVPDEIYQKITAFVQQEAQQAAQTLQTVGQPPPSPDDVQQRQEALFSSAEDAARKKAKEQARRSTDKIDELLHEGSFYDALSDMITMIPIFPFVCLKGPTVRMVVELEWPPGGGQPVVKQVPKLFWAAPSPFDIYFTPGVSDIKNAEVIEKMRFTRAEINDLLDLPGYYQPGVLAVLDEYGRGGLYDNWDTPDAERAVLENRENPAWNRSGLISVMSYNGNVQGRMLKDYGVVLPPNDPQGLRDYNCEVLCIGAHVIRANLSVSPRKRHPYYITSFDKVPGGIIGNALGELIGDLQEVANATLRSLVNNLSIASGPQVVIDEGRLSPTENADDMYPWKRWRVRNDPIGANTNNDKGPIWFFQPNSNSTDLLKVLDAVITLADDVSAIPKYLSGQNAGGAGRTASGLAMLMGNASKILQTVSGNIDRDIFQEALASLEELILLTDTTGVLTGMEKFVVKGVQVAIQRETQRQRQLELLQQTNNPTDIHIMGIKGRGALLRSVSGQVGLAGEEIVPPDEVLEKMQKDSEKNGQEKHIADAVQQGIVAGTKQAVTRIVSEMEAGVLAQDFMMPEGAPTHIGTPGQLPPPGGGNGASPGAPPGAPPSGSNGASPQGSPGNPHAKMSADDGPQTALVGKPAPAQPNQAIAGGPH